MHLKTAAHMSARLTLSHFALECRMLEVVLVISLKKAYYKFVKLSPFTQTPTVKKTNTNELYMPAKHHIKPWATCSSLP